MKIINYLIALLVITGISSCDSKYSVIDNGVYIAQAETSDHVSLTIDDNGGNTNITSRLSNFADEDVVVYYITDSTALSSYNRRNGTSYKLLPESFYSLSKTSVEIKKGQISSEPIVVHVNPFDSTLSASDKYAIPISIGSASDKNLLQDVSQSIVILVNQVIVTKVVGISTGQLQGSFATPLTNMTGWTLEWLVNKDAYNGNNNTQWNIKDALGGGGIYTRFGDVTCPPNQLQVVLGGKFNSNSTFTPGLWYHLALTYDGTNLKLYVNGQLDFIQQPSGYNEVSMGGVTFSNTKYPLRGKCAELRIWSVVRTQSQIANSMYIVDPKTPNLELYWKCDDGSGKIAKDYTDHGNNGNFTSNPTWYSGVRFPADQ